MMLLILSTLIGVVSLQLFALNYSIQGLNRAIVYTPIELMYKCVATVDEEPHFDCDAFETIMWHYYDSVLPRYTDGYAIDFYYYNIEDESMCITKYCNAVELTYDCVLNVTYHYHRVMYYQLVEAKNG